MNPRELTYEELIEFINELRHHGYHVSTEQYITVQRLLVALAASGSTLEHPPKLGKLLAPILCTSPEEQQSFYQLFEQWLTYQAVLLSNTERKTRHGSARVRLSDQGGTSPLSWAWLLSVFRTWPRNLKFITITIPLTIVIILIVGGSILLRFVTRLSSPTNDQVTLSGRITDENGQPVSNAQIQFSGRATSSDVNGYFALALRPQEMPIQLVINHSNYQGKSITVTQTTQSLQIQLSKQVIMLPESTYSRFLWWGIVLTATGIFLVAVTLWFF